MKWVDNRRDYHYKNEDPVKTVTYIQGILNDLGVGVTESWMEQSSAQTFSLRLSIDGTELGSNGKGITKEYARASAYAELMERMQNRWMGKCYLKNGDIEGHNQFYISPDEKKMPVDEVVEESNGFMDMLYTCCGLTHAKKEDKVVFLKEIHRLETLWTGNEEEWIMVPFYSVGERKTVYLPYFPYTCIYGSNGMCAGNTPKEAVVQGISEIIERYVQNEILKHHYALPDFPEELLSQYPEIEKRMKALNQLEGYRFILKDCSLGGKYPVIALASIELDTGNYGMKFGCHPDIGIAMERVITETSQGMDFSQYCRKSKLNFSNDIVSTADNFSNVCHTGRGQYPYEIFLSTPDFPFVHLNAMQNKTDEEMYDYYVNEVIGNENDVYIREASILGFPSYHIIVPTISEMNHYDRKRFKDIALKQAVSGLILAPSLITKENVPYLQYVLKTFGTNDMQSTIKSLSGVLRYTKDYPAEEISLGWLYMLIMCQIMQEKYEVAYQYMNMFLSVLSEQVGVDKVKYHGLSDYLKGRGMKLTHESCISYLKQFYRVEVVQWLDENFANPEEVFQKVYHDVIVNEKERNVHCDYDKYAQLTQKLHEKQSSKNLNQAMLGNVF